ncbi:YkvA family protein [Virgibacillus sp. CBA3643]|uniref:YkvA family protein n=1 Tax=Virgibacillus sp. CBA3643 TaxID=2942278 RepID=UPI0035A397FB
MYRFFNRIRFLFKFHKSIPFMKDFFISNEVKLATKVLFSVLIIGYIALPFDLIPDFIMLFGILDDTAIAIFLLQLMVKVAPESLKEKHNLFQ